MLARNPMTVTNLVAWLEKQPGDGAYNYANSINCMLCQYFRAVDVPFDSVTGTTFSLGEQKTPLPEHFDEIARGGEYMWENGGWTFGEALKRAKEYA